MGLLILWFAQLADILTTIWGGHIGLIEANQFVGHDPRLVIEMKALLLALATAVWALLPRARKLVAPVFYCGAGAVLFVAAQNMAVILAQK